MDYKEIRKIAIAIYTVNRHAKTAPDNRHLYNLKKSSIDKLIRTGHAEKTGLHFSNKNKYSQQSSTTLVQCQDFLFHIIPEKEDFQNLPHLGFQNETSRNPKEHMNLRTAREILYNFLDYKQNSRPFNKRPTQRSKHKEKPAPKGFRSSYLDG